MRTSLMFFSSILMSVTVLASEGPQADGGTSAPPAKAKAEVTQTQHSFEDLLVQGKYHFSDESLTTVEEDKVLNALIGVRQDFKDRLEISADRN